MNYTNKKVAITGYDGFLGAALVKALKDAGAEVYSVNGDIRDPESFDTLDFTFDYLFHFGAPSSQILFKRKPAYCVETTLKGFMNAADVCKQNGIRLVYPSTGLLSQGKSNEYARCKQLCEDYAKGLNMDAIGIRIFAAYGEGEGHKADYASVPYLFARDFAEEKVPVIFGDGNQVRDFIYIDDVVQAILHLAEECYDDVVDVGSGEQDSFNDIIDLLAGHANIMIKPRYVDTPSEYVSETLANPSRMNEFYKPKVSFAEGMKLTYDSIVKENKEINR